MSDLSAPGLTDTQARRLIAFVDEASPTGRLQVLVAHSTTTGLWHTYVKATGHQTDCRVDPGFQLQDTAVIQANDVLQLVGTRLHDLGIAVKSLGT